jgi:hypothetical protein
MQMQRTDCLPHYDTVNVLAGIKEGVDLALDEH